jgi:hypothetical protein
MENRDRDKLSRNTNSTPAGDVNRNTSSDIGKSQSGSSAEFGQNIGRSEQPESEPNRRSGNVDSGGLGSSSSVTGDRSSGSTGRNSGGSMGSSGDSRH